MHGIRIVTINTGKGDGPYGRRLQLLANQLAEIAPDIVACQEAFVAEEAHADTPGMLAKALGMHLFFTPAREKLRRVEGREVHSISGLAMLSRLAWQSQGSIALPSDERDGERVAQVGQVGINGLAVTIANLHLTHLAHADELRARQLAAVLNHPTLATADAPSLVCGDFNTAFDGPVLGPLLESQPPARVRDTWELGGGGGPRGTLVSRGPSVPCIDYILSLATAGHGHPPFASSGLALHQPGVAGGIFPSDHFAVTTVLHLDQPESGAAS